MKDRPSPHPESHLYASYWERAQWPLQGLYFLLPLLIAYEAGSLLLAPDGEQRLPPIVAESLLDRFFQMFGVTGVHLPAIIAVVVLFCLHLVRREPWRPEFKLYAVMWLETLGWAAPLFVFAMVLVREVPASSLSVLEQARSLTDDPSWRAAMSGMVFSIGAGIYEELLFRLIGIALLHMLFVDVLALPERFGGAAAIGVSALAFALYHFTESNPFSVGKLAFYMLAGVYFALIYVMRGFGIVAGTHALYDMLVVGNNLRLGEGLHI